MRVRMCSLVVVLAVTVTTGPSGVPSLGETTTGTHAPVSFPVPCQYAFLLCRASHTLFSSLFDFFQCSELIVCF